MSIISVSPFFRVAYLHAAHMSPSIIEQHPVALQLRYLQTVNEMASENNTTTIFPIPIDLFRPLMKTYDQALKTRDETPVDV